MAAVATQRSLTETILVTMKALQMRPLKDWKEAKMLSDLQINELKTQLEVTRNALDTLVKLREFINEGIEKRESGAATSSDESSSSVDL